MRRWSIPALAGSLALVVSLYLPWEEVSSSSSATSSRFGSTDTGAVAGLLNLFSGSALNVVGWSSAVSGPAALAASLLAALLIVGLVRPALSNRLPVGLCGLLAGYFALAVAVGVRSDAHSREFDYRQLGRFHYHYAYGAYLGVAGGIIVVLATAGLRRDEIVDVRAVSRAVAAVLAGGLLVSLLLPWVRFTAIHSTTSPGIESPAAILAVVAICLAAVRWSAGSSIGTLALSATALLLIGAAFSGVTLGVAHVYGAWVALALCLAFAGFAAVSVSDWVQFRSHARPAVAVVAMFLIALFLPWQKVCYPTGASFGSYGGRCLTTNGWVALSGSTAAVLSLLVVLAVLVPRRSAVSAAELAIGTALLVATLGFELVPSGARGVHLGYGSVVGFCAVALLLLTVVPRSRQLMIDRTRMAVRLLPITACLSYLALLVVPWWDVLPRRLASASLFQFASVSWLTIAGALIGIHLLGSWLRRSAGGAASPTRLVVLPLAMLTLAALDLIRLRDVELTWGGGVIVGLCVVLALLGRVEAQSGLENMRVPEILRVDRL